MKKSLINAFAILITAQSIVLFGGYKFYKEYRKDLKITQIEYEITQHLNNKDVTGKIWWSSEKRLRKLYKERDDLTLK